MRNFGAPAARIIKRLRRNFDVWNYFAAQAAI